MSDKKTVLLVDDDQSLRRVLEYQLQEDGYDVVAVANGEAALEQFHARAVDVIVTDVRMPAMNGIELLSRIKVMQPDIPVVVLTAHGTIGSAVEAMKLGALDYLTKPFTREQLRMSVGKALDVAALKSENRRLRAIVAERFSFSNMIAGSRAMRGVTDMASRVAPTDTTVLLSGESGTGKELLAKAIHLHSERKRQPFVTVNCAAIPENLLESELFGHRRGAFTGAVADKQGKFEAANTGTIFLDEIGELPLQMQVKILRVLQEREIDKVGEPKPLKVNVRIIAATNRDLEKMIEAGTFREDLYYRLNVMQIRIPPLREHASDIPLLVNFYLDAFNREFRKQVRGTTDEGMAHLRAYRWPGNIRELRNAVERAMLLADGEWLTLEHFPMNRVSSRPEGQGIELPVEGLSLETVERELVVQALARTGWNQTKAAALLGLNRDQIRYRVEKFGLEKSAERE